MTGKFLSPRTVRAIVDSDIDATKERMQQHARDLQAGAISTEDFKARMMQEIKDLHLAEVAAARGGKERMRQSDYGRAGQRIRYHYEKLQGLIDDIEADPDFIHGVDGRMDFIQRVGMYASAGRNTFATTKDVEMNAAGFKFKSNRLEPTAHHCKGERSCPAMTALGRVKINDPRYIMEGDRVCGPECECETEYWMAAA